MNILFFTVGPFSDIEEHSIYLDLVRCFRDYGHRVYTVSPYERRQKKETELITHKGVISLYVKCLNITKCGMIEKGLASISIKSIFLNAIEKYFSSVSFDLVLYVTPPIIFGDIVEYICKRDHAKSYLILKDIFPQNAIDIGVLAKSGIKGIVYRYFRKKEKKLYQVSDYIGCMSFANADYLLRHNPGISKERVEVCPNAIEIIDKSVDASERDLIRRKYGIPLGKTVFVYGGNLGQPQGVDFICRCMEQISGVDAYFLIVGDGAEYGKLARFFEKKHPYNARLMQCLPKDEYDTMIGACDVGLIFLDYRFTIPNFPSRLLSYMQAHLPVLACTDSNTDVGKVIVEGGFGWWCPSNDVNQFLHTVQNAMQADRKTLGEKAWRYLKAHYDVEIAYKIIISHFEKE